MPEVGAISGEDIYENLIQIFDDFEKNGFILTLDYGKAFDSVDTRLSCRLLLRHGWPVTLVKLLGSVWGQQSSFIQWDHHTHFQPLDSSCVQVQGDLLGPLVMSLWVMAGVASVTATTQVNSSTKVYIDDRTVTCNSAPNLFRMFTALLGSLGVSRSGWSRVSPKLVLLLLALPWLSSPVASLKGVSFSLLSRSLGRSLLARVVLCILPKLLGWPMLKRSFACWPAVTSSLIIT